MYTESILTIDIVTNNGNTVTIIGNSRQVSNDE